MIEYYVGDEVQHKTYEYIRYVIIRRSLSRHWRDYDLRVIAHKRKSEIGQIKTFDKNGMKMVKKVKSMKAKKNHELLHLLHK